MSEARHQGRLGTKSALGATQDSEPDRLVLQVQIKERWLNAWIDCGAKQNFIDPRLVTELALPWKKKQLPYPLVNAEGQLFDYNNGIVDQETDHLYIHIQGRIQKESFDVIPLGTEIDIILGMPWLRRTNPRMDWTTGQVTLPRNSDSYVKIITRNTKRSQTLTKEDGMGKHGAEYPSPPKGVRHKHKIGTRRKSEILGILRQQDKRKDKEPEPSQDRLKKIPEEYQIYDKLFKEELETGIPKHSQWDHKIKLTDERLPVQKLYPLN